MERVYTYVVGEETLEVTTVGNPATKSSPDLFSW